MGGSSSRWEGNSRRPGSTGLLRIKKYFRQVPTPSYDPSLEGLSNYILENECRNVVALTGAGISEGSWFSDLRLLMKKIEEPIDKLDKIHQLFDLTYFHSDPQMLYNLMKPLLTTDDGYPSLAYSFIRLLDEKEMLVRHYTENMDDQEYLAGVPQEKVVKANGTYQTWTCVECRASYLKDWVAESLLFDELPKCIKCASIVRPDIVFFGEQLPRKFFENLTTDMEQCDLMLILGSSLSFEPFSCLPSMVGKEVPRLVMNETELSAGLGLKIGTRDVFWKGNPNQGCIELAKNLGWNIELGNLRLELDQTIQV